MMKRSNKKRRYLVVSDLHLTNGIDPATGRWSPTEDFFWDEHFRDFLQHYTEPPGTTLILNGDIVDFLQVLTLPTEIEREDFGITESEVNGAYGLRCTEGAAEFQIQKTIQGHPVFFQALADFALAGNEIVVLKGNHDIQLHWPRVRERIRTCLAERNPKFRRESIHFHPWCYLVPDLLYVEHGNQYEEECAFRNFLYPLLPMDLDGRKQQLEIDLSGFLVRYVSAPLETVNPLADNVRPMTDYFKALWKDHPSALVTTFWRAVKYVLKAFAKGREMKARRVQKRLQEIEQKNVQVLEAEAALFSKGSSTLKERLRSAFHEIEDFHCEPTLVNGPWVFLMKHIRNVLGKVAWLIPLYGITLVPDFTKSLKARFVDWGIAEPSGVMDSLIQWNVIQCAMVVILGGFLLWLRWFTNWRKSAGPSSVMGDVSMALREDARKIANILKVKYVTFGHSHYPDIDDLSEGRRYFNTGTWMGIYNQEEQLYRGEQQFTFLDVKDGNAHLLRWNPDAHAPQPVVVMDTESPLEGPEDGIIKLIADALKLRW